MDKEISIEEVIEEVIATLDTYKDFLSDAYEKTKNENDFIDSECFRIASKIVRKWCDENGAN